MAARAGDPDPCGFGVLAQLLDLYRVDFRSDENKYELPGGEIVTRAEEYDRFAVRLGDILLFSLA